jgi:cyclopropane fatty-acyl-phospholipid synthase-like methyltransferase
MKFSYNRNEFVANKLGNLNGEKILDIGCRDEVFKKYLKGKFDYHGIDYDPNDGDYKENRLNYNLEKGLPDLEAKFDIINALDVLEHLENIHEIFSHLFEKSNNIISIALPNMGYYKFRLNFMFKGEISEKYTFHSKKIYDRHRWLPNYNSIINFVNDNRNKNWEFDKYEFIAERKKFSMIYYIEKILSKVFPNFFVYEVIYIFKKKLY